ncbi:MAG: hypothetical protein IKO40_11795 [Kiritimatiellae bacterium]|nr:hypothetical protein [Kiritimatiellia bacterium]
MKTHLFRKVLLGVGATHMVLVVLVVSYLKLPVLCPSFAWKTKIPDLQEMAIPHLMKKLYIGMSYEELVDIMGTTNFKGVNSHDGVEYISYNVNFEFNCGIDIEIKDGKVISIFEYN